jgi:UDP-N-acetylglucosamine 2-epimerase (non-hydrolysing)
MKKRIAICYGTRPEYIKLKKIINLIPKTRRDVFFVGQHDKLISKNIFSKKITILKNKKRLDSIFAQTILKINFNKVNSVLIQGDTASALACAIAAFNQGKKIIYLESGLRSFDFKNPFPEEGYRQMISRIADINLSPTLLSKKNLLNESVKGKIYVTGNTALDNLIFLKKKTSYSNIVPITLHRRENLNKINLWFRSINNIAKNYKNLKFVIPIHANPLILKNSKIFTHVKVIKNLEHEKFINILKNSRFIITDSGGIQEEGSFFNKKIILCRTKTERPEGIKTGHILICKRYDDLATIVNNVALNYKVNKKCPYGDGHSSKRIFRILKKEKIL